MQHNGGDVSQNEAGHFFFFHLKTLTGLGLIEFRGGGCYSSCDEDGNAKNCNEN